MEARKILLSHYFTQLAPYKALCKFCCNYGGLDMLDHMRMHLKTKHPEQYCLFEANLEAAILEANKERELRNEANEEAGASEDAASSPVTNSDTSSSADAFQPPKKMSFQRMLAPRLLVKSDIKKINERLIHTFIGSYQPFSVISEPKFINFGTAVNTVYRMPNEKAFTSKIPLIYVECLEKKKKLLMEEATHVSLSAERWTSASSHQYIVITAHYVNKTLQPASVLLKNLHLGDTRDETPTDEAISVEIEKILRCWNILEKVQTVTTEKYSNLTTAMSIHDHNWENFSCYISELNEAFIESIKLFEEITTKVKVIADHFLRSYEAAELLFEHQRQIESKTEVKQLTTCDMTRWESIYGMLQTFSELENGLKANFPYLEAKLPDVTENDWVAIREICAVLKPFIHVVKSLSMDGYLSGSMPIVLTNDLLFVFEQVKNDKYCTIVADLLEMVHQSISNVFTDLKANDSLAICTFLDPRFKQRSFRDKWTGEIARRIVLDLLQQCINGESEKDLSDREDAAVSEETQFRAAHELEMYLKEPVIDRSDCPHAWWQNHREDYPNLAKIYVKRCHVVASSVPCNRLLTEEGRILVDRRARIPHHDVERLVFLNANYSPSFCFSGYFS